MYMTCIDVYKRQLKLLLKNKRQKLSSKPRNYCNGKDYFLLMSH